jgi:hypothetical protein
VSHERWPCRTFTVLSPGCISYFLVEAEIFAFRIAATLVLLEEFVLFSVSFTLSESLTLRGELFLRMERNTSVTISPIFRRPAMLDRFYFVLEQCVTTNHRSENIMGLPDSVIGVRRSGQANKSKRWPRTAARHGLW